MARHNAKGETTGVISALARRESRKDTTHKEENNKTHRKRFHLLEFSSFIFIQKSELLINGSNSSFEGIIKAGCVFAAFLLFSFSYCDNAKPICATSRV
jgi:hypothetical protein